MKKGLIGIIVGLVVLIIILVVIGTIVIPGVKKLPETGQKALIKYNILPSERYNITIDESKSSLGKLVFTVFDNWTGNYTTNFSKLTGYKVYDNNMPAQIKKVEAYSSLSAILLGDQAVESLASSYTFTYDNTIFINNSISEGNYWTAINKTTNGLSGGKEELAVLIINRSSGCSDVNCSEDETVLKDAIENLEKVDYVFIVVPELSDCNNFPEINATATILGINLSKSTTCKISSSSTSCYKNDQDTAFCLGEGAAPKDIANYITKLAATIELTFQTPVKEGAHNITLTVKRSEGLMEPSYKGSTKYIIPQ